MFEKHNSIETFIIQPFPVKLSKNANWNNAFLVFIEANSFMISSKSVSEFLIKMKWFRRPHLARWPSLETRPVARISQQGGANFFNTILDICSNWGPNMKWGGTYFKWGARHHWSLSWRQPCWRPLYKGPVSVYWKTAHSLQYILPLLASFSKQFEECQNFRTW